MFRVAIRSRLGNGVLGVLGVIYFLSAGGILIYYIVSSWGADSLVDRVLQLGLAGAALCGLVFVIIAVGNLGVRQRAGSAVQSRTAPDRRTTSAVGS